MASNRTSEVPATIAHLAFWRILGLGVLMYVLPGITLALLAIWQVDAAGALAIAIATHGADAATVAAP